MTPTLKALRVPLLIGAVAAALYLPRLGDAPIYVSPDEVFVALHAHALATTGRDHGGHLLPLYVQYQYAVYDRTGRRIDRNGWLPPAVYYATAIALEILPFSEASIRLPTVAIGVIDVLLVYFIGRRLFKTVWLAVLAACLLALTPSHFIHSRFALDYVYPLPFLLAWLLALLTYLEKGGERTLFLGTLALGVGLYSYIAAALVMPLYLLMTWIALWRTRHPRRAYALSAAGFALPVMLAVPWLIVHPSMVTDILSKYAVSGSESTTALQSVRAFLTYHRIGDQLSRWWSFFDPRFLFFDGPAELMYSTREVGVFLLPVAPLLLVGIYALLRRSISAPALLILAGFFTAPLAATLVNVNDAIYRALELLPFAVLIAVYGIRHLWIAESIKPSRRILVAAGLAIVGIAILYSARTLTLQSRLPGAAVPMLSIGVIAIVLAIFSDWLRLGQMTVIALLVMMPVQFASFYADYFDNYRVRSSLIFSGNVRAALEEALNAERQAKAPRIYLAKITPYNKGGIYWEFYLIKHTRQDLLARTLDAGGLNTENVLMLEPGSLVISNAGEGPTDREIDRLVAAGVLSKTVIREPDGTASYYVMRRTGGG